MDEENNLDQYDFSGLSTDDSNKEDDLSQYDFSGVQSGSSPIEPESSFDLKDTLPVALPVTFGASGRS